MTKFFQYDTLTWPAVKDLTRKTPLLIPLGENSINETIAETLGNPPSLGILPSIPYGWSGSGLIVPSKFLAKFVRNLVTSLQDDGFTNVFAITTKKIDFNLGEIQIGTSSSSRKMYDQHNSYLLPSSDRNKVVVIPIGHTEQHGYHLPLSTDTLIIDAIATGIVNQVPELATRLPVYPYGVSTHRQAFAGTLNAGGRAFEDFWGAVIDNLVTRGFTRFYFISGHGGNCSFLVNIVKYAGERYPRIFCATSWLYLSGNEGVDSITIHRESAQGGMGHAGELETSLILHLRPDLVAMEKVVDEMDFINTQSYYMDWVEGGPLIANPPWYDDTQSGSYGAGSLGTAQKGKVWLEDAIKEKVGHVHEIHEQYSRREARRSGGYGLWGQ